MKTEFVDVNDTRKNLVVEIPSEVVDAEIDRLARQYSRTARVPGFRPGKVPARLIKQRFREQILHDVAHDLIPRAVDDALRERGVEPVDTPDIRDVVVEEGRPLTFTASFETVPPIEPGDYEAIALRRPPVSIEEAEVERALEQLRQHAARHEPVEDRPIGTGDTVAVDLTRQRVGPGASGPPERHENVSVEIGAAINPPGFDDELIGLAAGAQKTFTVHYPPDHAIKELAGSDIAYEITVKGIKRRVVPNLDDEFAKDVGEFATLDELRERVRADLVKEGEQRADRQLRGDLLRALAERVTFEVPAALVDREVDRRVEDFVRRLIAERVDPRQMNIDWEEFRRNQQGPATESVKAALVLDEVARREGLSVNGADLDREVALIAERTARTVPAVRAQLEKEGGLARLGAGLRREKAVDFLLSRATIART